MSTRLWKTSGLALVIALFGEVWLSRTRDNSSAFNFHKDAYASVLSIVGGVLAFLMIVTHYWEPVKKWGNEVIFAVFVLWVAQFTETVFEHSNPGWFKIRQGCFYLAFAIVALGMYLVQYEEEKELE